MLFCYRTSKILSKIRSNSRKSTNSGQLQASDSADKLLGSSGGVDETSEVSERLRKGGVLYCNRGLNLLTSNLTLTRIVLIKRRQVLAWDRLMTQSAINDRKRLKIRQLIPYAYIIIQIFILQENKLCCMGILF